MAKNQYAVELQERRKAREYLIKIWTIQLCLDCFQDVLNDPSVMGKDVFGSDRLTRVGAAFNEKLYDMLPALSDSPDGEYARAVIDRRLSQIHKGNFLKWAERYEVGLKINFKRRMYYGSSCSIYNQCR